MGVIPRGINPERVRKALSLRQNRGNLPMHSFMVATVFVAMVLAPCVVAMFTGIDNSEETL
jgi:hypothetical protein